MLDERNEIIEISREKVVKIYKAIFTDKEPKDNIVNISRQCYIDDPKRYKNLLINACNLLSSDTKLD